MIKKVKIQAFTLGELLVVMVISSIVVTLSFLALENVQRQIRSINSTFEKQQKILKLERMLTMDFEKNKSWFDATKSRLYFFNGQDSLEYTVKNNSVVRGVDTIQLNVQEKRFYLEGEEVTNGEFDAVEFTFLDTYNQQGFFIYRKHDASHFMNN